MRWADPPQARFASDVVATLGATDVVLNIGTNDIAEGRDAAAIEAGLRAVRGRGARCGQTGVPHHDHPIGRGRARHTTGDRDA